MQVRGVYRPMRIDEPVRAEALARCRALPVYAGSHRKGAANLVGALGEIAFERLLIREGIGFEDQRHDTRHDYRVAGRVTVDVKTKDRTVTPAWHYDNSVPAYNHGHQRPDYFFFVSLHRDRLHTGSRPVDAFTHAYLLGGIGMEALERGGTHWATGQLDPANGTRFWTACINVSMGQLISPAPLLRLWQGRTFCRVTAEMASWAIRERFAAQ